MPRGRHPVSIDALSQRQRAYRRALGCALTRFQPRRHAAAATAARLTGPPARRAHRRRRLNRRHLALLLLRDGVVHQLGECGDAGQRRRRRRGRVRQRRLRRSGKRQPRARGRACRRCQRGVGCRNLGSGRRRDMPGASSAHARGRQRRRRLHQLRRSCARLGSRSGGACPATRIRSRQRAAQARELRIARVQEVCATLRCTTLGVGVGRRCRRRHWRRPHAALPKALEPVRRRRRSSRHGRWRCDPASATARQHRFCLNHGAVCTVADAELIKAGRARAVEQRVVALVGVGCAATRR